MELWPVPLTMFEKTKFSPQHILGPPPPPQGWDCIQDSHPGDVGSWLHLCSIWELSKPLGQWCDTSLTPPPQNVWHVHCNFSGVSIWNYICNNLTALYQNAQVWTVSCKILAHKELDLNLILACISMHWVLSHEFVTNQWRVKNMASGYNFTRSLYVKLGW